MNYSFPVLGKDYPGGLQTLAHAFADQGCYLFSLAALAHEWRNRYHSELPMSQFKKLPSAFDAALYGVSSGNVTTDGTMSCKGHEISMIAFLTNTLPSQWEFRKEAPGYSTTKKEEFLIGRYSGILKVNPIKHYIFLKSEGTEPLVDSMVVSPIVKKGSISSVHVFTYLG